MKKRSVSIFLVISMLLTLLPNMILTASEAPVHGNPYETDTYFDFPMNEDEQRHTVDDVLQILSEEGPLHYNLRAHTETGLEENYLVPITKEEIEYLKNSEDGMQALSIPYPVTKIRDSGRPDSESIVIVLMGDGFTASQYGTWPNPASGTALHHAKAVMDTVTATIPFSYFTDYISVYMIHAPSTQSGVGRFGTIDAAGALVFTSANDRTAIRQLADAVIPRANQTMVHIISNAGGSIAGYAYMDYNYDLFVNIGVTSIRRTSNPVGGTNDYFPPGHAWHGTFLHELGHGFGHLADESTSTPQANERCANSTQAAEANIKWQYWYGHRAVKDRRIQANQIRHNNWAFPGDRGCLMYASWSSRVFCGVCASELTRRLAFVSGDTFLGRSPHTNNSAPNSPTVTIPLHETRILDSAFHGNTTINTVNIHELVSTIGDFAFIGATGLKTIVNESVIPQQINETTFAGVNRANVEVRVPPGTMQAYINAGWTGFNLITGVEQPNITTNLPVSAVLDEEPLTLTITANSPNGGVISYQWFRNGTAIPGATGTTYTVTQTGSYHVVVSNNKDGDVGTRQSTTCVVSEPAVASIIQLGDAIVSKGSNEAAVLANFRGEVNGTSTPLRISEGTVNYAQPGDYTVTIAPTSGRGSLTNIKVTVVEQMDYASDLDWTTASKSGWGSLQKDAGISESSGRGSSLKVTSAGGIVEYRKGIGTHANSEVIYNVAGKGYNTFRSYVGIDRNRDRANAAVVFTVLVDGAEKYKSATMTQNTQAVLVNVDITGANEVKLVATFTSTNNSGCHASWVDTMFIGTGEEISIPVYGDVNSDGVINAADSTMLRLYITATNKQAFKNANLSFNEANADVNGDGNIDPNDVVLLRRYLAATDPLLVPLGSD